MADFISSYTKNTLLLLAKKKKKIETSLSKSDKIKAIIQAITGASDYDEIFAFRGSLSRKNRRKGRN